MRFSWFRGPSAVPPDFVVVGLGNPGAQYERTRHNVGFEAVDLLGRRHRIEVKAAERRSLVGYGEIAGRRVALVKPITYMNLCGESLAPLLRQWTLPVDRLLVVVDDMDLPVGRLRLRGEGSAGGHNGLKSLIQHLGTDEFPRLRIGVGRPSREEVVEHVLGKFDRRERELIAETLERVADAVECVLGEGLEAAMNRYNVRPAEERR